MLIKEQSVEECDASTSSGQAATADAMKEEL